MKKEFFKTCSRCLQLLCLLFPVVSATAQAQSTIEAADAAITGRSIAQPADRLSGTLLITLDGVDEDLKDNVKSSLSAFGFNDERIITYRRMLSLQKDAAKQLNTALQPFGYYHPEMDIQVSDETDGWHWRMTIDKGPAVKVVAVDLQIQGEGSELDEFKQWQQNWPLTEGKRLIHADYETAKQSFAYLAESLGFFDHQLNRHEILVDAKTNEARIYLSYATGPQFVYGDISITADSLNQRVLDRFYLVKPGDPYTASSLEKIRKVMAGTLYFKHVSSRTEINRDSSPPLVKLTVEPELRERNRIKTTLGYGTDKGGRILVGWERRLLSPRGDRLQTGLGLQQKNTEITFRSDYKLPITRDASKFFIATAQYLRQNDEFKFIDDGSNEPVFHSIDGPRDLFWLRGGQQTELWSGHSSSPLLQTLFLGLLVDNYDALNSTNDAADDLIAKNPDLESFLKTSQTSLVLGSEWDWMNLKGTGFRTSGIHARGRILLANESVGSDISFAQAYLGTHFSMLFGNRLKLTIRGELGYTDAPVDELTVVDGDTSVKLSMTRLPSQFRFNAGGTYSVRGYGYEALSNNENGSNHIITASTELEYRVNEDWSVDAFADIGNAFNDFSNPHLKSGVGMGIRYYTVVGPIRLDFAYPLDDFDNSLRIHFSLGVPLLNLGKVLP